MKATEMDDSSVQIWGWGAGCATQERIKEQQHRWSKVLLGQEPGLPSKSRQDISLIRGVELSSLACHVESTNGSPDCITGLDPRVGKRPESGQHRHYLGELLRTGCVDINHCLIIVMTFES